MTNSILTGIGLAALLLAAPAQAQSDPTITVQNGAVLTVSGGAVVDIQGGLLDFGGVDETARLNETDSARITGGTLTATRTLSAPSGENVAGLGFTLTSSADLGATTVTRTHDGASVGGQPAADRTYSVSPTGQNSALGATVVLAYAEAELGDLSESDLAAYRDAGDGFVRLATTTQPSADQVTATNVDRLGLFALASGSAVEPASVAGTLAYGDCPEPPATLAGERPRCFLQVSGENLLATAQRYTIFLFIDGLDGEAAGYGRRAFRGEIKLGPGESAAQQVKLQFSPADPAGTYAVSLVAAEGSVAAPGEEAVVLDELEVLRADGAGLRLDEPLAVYPNPSAGAAVVRFAVPEATQVRVVVYDALGREVARLLDREAEGLMETRLDGVAPGLYLVRLTTDSGRAETVGLSVTR